MFRGPLLDLYAPFHCIPAETGHALKQQDRVPAACNPCERSVAWYIVCITDKQCMVGHEDSSLLRHGRYSGNSGACLPGPENAHRERDMLLKNATIATFSGTGYGLIENGAILTDGPLIGRLGNEQDVARSAPAGAEVMDCRGRLVTPGLVDCHTHAVHAGNRVREFEIRLEGGSYEAISKVGGGILSTVASVRQASVEELVAASLPRVMKLMSEGVTTIEIKSGYGLDTENEIKMLRAAQLVAERTGVRIHKTFLGAHAVAPEFAGRSDEYIDKVCREMLPAAHERDLVDSVDGFVEGIAFSAQQMKRVFTVAERLELPVRLHAEQLSHAGGTEMAVRHGALSVDHLEHIDEHDVLALSGSGTVAVLLPGAFYFLKQTRSPPVELLRQHGIPIAVATDCNPGSSPLSSMLMALNMSCMLFGLTPREALAGATVNGARALGMQDRIGRLAPGMEADLVLWNARDPAELSYHMGLNPCHRIMIRGNWQESPVPTCDPIEQTRPDRSGHPPEAG